MRGSCKILQECIIHSLGQERVNWVNNPDAVIANFFNAKYGTANMSAVEVSKAENEHTFLHNNATKTPNGKRGPAVKVDDLVSVLGTKTVYLKRARPGEMIF